MAHKQGHKPTTPKPNPKDVPLGSGSAGQARRAVAGRARQIDDAVERMERGENRNSGGGSLSRARRPRAY